MRHQAELINHIIRKDTRTKASKRLGITRQHLHNLISGQKQPSEDLLRRIAETYGVSINTLIRARVRDLKQRLKDQDS